MAPNRAFIFKSVPANLPVIGENIAVEPVAAYDSDGACPEGGIFVKSLYASIDPYQRSRMRPMHIPSYQPALPPGTPIAARGLAEVLKSDTPAFKPGDTVVGYFPIQEYVACSKEQLAQIRPLDNPLGISDIRNFLGALGVPGLTAYGGLFEIGKPQKGQTIFISAASGAVGQIVGQLARLEGLRTIGSVGSDEKLAYITAELGFDAGFNYKKETPSEALARLAPEGVDIYFDNVGGEHLEAALRAMKDFGRVVVCGAIADYNADPLQQYPLRAHSLIFAKRLTLRGFIVSDPDIAPKYAAEHQQRVQKWVKEGTIKTRTWEVVGIEEAPAAFLALFTGGNFGKTVLKFGN